MIFVLSYSFALLFQWECLYSIWSKTCRIYTYLTCLTALLTSTIRLVVDGTHQALSWWYYNIKYGFNSNAVKKRTESHALCQILFRLKKLMQQWSNICKTRPRMLARQAAVMHTHTGSPVWGSTHHHTHHHLLKRKHRSYFILSQTIVGTG